MQYYFVTEERLYFIMPFIGGGEISMMLKALGKFNERMIKFYATQLVLGIKHLHENDIMHRDLKLSNLMINTDGFLKIVDFGLAQVLRHGQFTTSIVGTPSYMAPEILKQEQYDKTADWWSVGIILYQMLTGTHPFLDRNVHK